ncbi:ATP-dependent helicase [Mitsuokella jalaludinii]|uniref:ATP-dependent helicase n=1 Tax=Mitsuokella jalaludinii TaxID=187979 RepID=UPI003F9D602A
MDEREDGQLLQGLNDAQREAVTTTEGFVRVLAGAGSGKTRALAHRFAYLVEELGILPGNILCVTFTNKAAAEMRSRIHALTGDNDTGYINTFHGFCVSILQEDSHAVGYPKSFLVLDNADIDDMLAKIYEERGLTLRDMTYGQARDMFEMRKLVQQPDYYKELIALPLAGLKEKYDRAQSKQDVLFYGYLYEQKKCFGLDYNDLIKFSLYIFAEHEEIRKKWQQRLEYIMIDEFQDIDEPQYRLMNVLCGWHKNLFVVGDPDQTIYSWRGASGRYLLDFDAHFPGTKTIFMLENYRSTPEILAAVNSLIAKNTSRVEKNLVPVCSHGQKVICHHAAAADEEGAWLAGEIGQLHAAGVPYRDMAVLYRAHYITRSIEEQLLKAELPYMIYSGVQFFARREIKDALSYLRMLAYRDDLSFLRIVNVPKRNIGERRRKFLTAYAEEHQLTLWQALKESLEDPIWRGTKAKGFIALIENLAELSEGGSVSEILARVLDKSGYEMMLRTEGSQARLDNLAELKQSVREYEVNCGEEAGLMDYLNHAALFTNQDVGDPGDKVRLMTVHTAKGLEFPYVFLCGLNEGIFPSRKTRTPEAMEEERRLAFVAMTRAEKGLYLSDAEGLHIDGSLRYPSRFIFDIEPELLEFTAPLPEKLVRDAKDYICASSRRLLRQAEPAAFREGTRITHRVFGDGTIVALDAEKGAYVIHFDELATNRSISFRVKLQQL